jgi:hypothetical protein
LASAWAPIVAVSPLLLAASERVNHRRDPIGPRRHGLPRRLGQGPSKAELRLDRKGLAGTGIAGMVRRTRDLGGDHKAHGRNERRVAGNGDTTQRTRQRSKAMKSAASRGSDEQAALPLRWEPAARTERPQLRLRSHPGPPSGGPERCPRATPGSESAPGGGSIAHPRCPCFGIGCAGRFSRDYDGSFGFRTRRVFGDVGVRASGSEHHRIGISSSHPVPSLRARTPVIPGIRGDSSELSRAVPAPAGTPRPEEWTPAIEADPPVFGPVDPSRRDPATELFGAPPSRFPPGSDPRLFGTRTSPPGTRDPFHRGRPRRSSERWTHLVGPGDGALRSPALPRPRIRRPGSSESARPFRWDRPPALRGAVAPPQAGRSVVRPPRQRGSRSVWSPVSAGAPPPGRTATTGWQRSQ